MRCCCAVAVGGGTAASGNFFFLLPIGVGVGSRGAPPTWAMPSWWGYGTKNASGGVAHLEEHTGARYFGEWGWWAAVLSKIWAQQLRWAARAGGRASVTHLRMLSLKLPRRRIKIMQPHARQCMGLQDSNAPPFWPEAARWIKMEIRRSNLEIISVIWPIKTI